MKITRFQCHSLRLTPALVIAAIVSSATPLQAQPPRVNPSQGISRARQACDQAAALYGYQVMRRDRENQNGTSTELPMHVLHGGSEADVTCRYDAQRGVADLPRWEDRANQNGDRRYGRRGDENDDRRDARREDENEHRGHGRRGSQNGGRYGNQGDMAQQVQSLCQDYVNNRRNYRVITVGTPTLRGQNLYDVPVTVQRNNGQRESTVTCRYNAASNKLSLR